MPSIALDASVVKTTECPADKARVDLYDTVIPGFIVEIRATGGKTYYLRYRDQHGKQKQYKIGDTKSLTFEQARNAAQTLRAKVVLGDSPSAEKAATRRVPTLEFFITKHYLPYIKSCKRGWKINLSTLKHHILPALGHLHLDELKQPTIVKLLAEMRIKYAAATTNRVLTMLRFMYNLARKWEIPGAENNPTTGIHRFEENYKERYLTAEEVQRLQVAVLENTNPQLKYIVALLLLTGCRKRELLDSKWEDFDLDRRNWRIPMSKNGKPRHVPLSTDALIVLGQLPRFESCPYVVPNPDTLKPFNTISHSWMTARKKAGMPELRMHDLRHSFASFLVNAGRSLYEVQNILGHSQLSMTQRYAHLSQSTLLDATNSVSSAAGLQVGSWVGTKSSEVLSTVV